MPDGERRRLHLRAADALASAAGDHVYAIADQAIASGDPESATRRALAAGIDGIVNARDPGPRLDINMYTESEKAPDAPRLPLNLLDAVRALEASDVLGQALGDLVPSYVKLKHAEWNDYARHLTDWERATTLDC